MKKATFAILMITGIIMLMTYCGRKSVDPISEDPIGTIGHGSILDKNGKQLQLTEKLIRQIQELYIRKLSDERLEKSEGGQFNIEKIKATQSLIYKTVSDAVLANALLVDWLVEQRKPAGEAQFTTVNNALRWYYVHNIKKNPILPDEKKTLVKRFG